MKLLLILIVTLYTTAMAYSSENVDLNSDIYCVSQSARSRMIIYQEENKISAQYVGTERHQMRCTKMRLTITCSMPNDDKISISKSSIQFVEQRESVDGEIYTLFTIFDSAEGVWKCSNTNF